METEDAECELFWNPIQTPIYMYREQVSVCSVEWSCGFGICSSCCSQHLWDLSWLCAKRTSLWRLAGCPQHGSLSLVPKSLSVPCISVSAAQHLWKHFLWCFCYVITIDILVLVDSGSLENSSLTHGKVFEVWIAERNRHVLKPCMLAWSQSQNWVFSAFSFF